jgi:predicted DNA-binding protein YlxM (UPF0122 family)
VEEFGTDFLRILRFVEPWQRVILFLYFHEEYTNTEIGIMCQLSESRIGQIIKDTTKRLHTILEREKQREDKEISQEVSGETEERPKAFGGISKGSNVKMEDLLQNKERNGLEQQTYNEMENGKPREMEGAYEARFDEWLT